MVGCIEIPAKYHGGYAAMSGVIVTNFKYPDVAVNERVTGRLVVHFAIDTMGNLVNPKMFKSLCLELDEEALRVISLLQGWLPATSNGKKIIFYQSLPIVFRPEDDVSQILFSRKGSGN
jgi:outer membrane biosynthesis protein TonB